MRSLFVLLHEKLESAVNDRVKFSVSFEHKRLERGGDLRGKGTGTPVLNEDDNKGGVCNELESGWVNERVRVNAEGGALGDW